MLQERILSAVMYGYLYHTRISKTTGSYFKLITVLYKTNISVFLKLKI